MIDENARRFASTILTAFAVLISSLASSPGKHVGGATAGAVAAAGAVVFQVQSGPVTGDSVESGVSQEAQPQAEPAAGSAPAVSEDSSDELSPEELAMLEESLAADSDSATDSKGDEPTSGGVTSAGAGFVGSMNPEIALILDVAFAAFSDEPLQVGAHDPSANGFNLQQLELSMGANIDPYFRLDANIVFSQFGVEVEEAYATTLALPWNLQARAGQFLTPFGRLNPTHPHSWRFLDQPLVNGKFFGGEGSRGLGAELSWLAPLPWFVEVTGAANQADGECCARSFYGGENLGVDGPADLLYTTRLEQFFPMGAEVGLLWGMTAQFGPNPTGLGNRSEIYGTDFYLRWRPQGSTSRTSVDLTLEAMMRQRQVPDDVLRDFGSRTELVWNIVPRWQVGARHEWVTGVENDPLDPEWNGNRQRVALQGTFIPSHFSRLRLQTAWDAPQWRDDPILAVMLGLEVLAGAHGSHEY